MNNSFHQKNNVVVALDIGTTKICAIVGRKNELGRIEVMGYGKVSSEGVRRGVVANIDKTVTAISDAVDNAEKMANVEISDVFVGIAGQHIKSLATPGHSYSGRCGQRDHQRGHHFADGRYAQTRIAPG